MLYAIEGIDASGKKTQAEMLASALGPQASYWAFPQYRTRTGKLIGQLLRKELTIEPEDPMTTALILQTLFSANRYEALPLLRMHEGVQGADLVLDRYFASGLVYGQADGLPLSWLLDVHSGLPSADLWILIDLPVEESMRRRPERQDKYERNVQFLSDVVHLYRKQFAAPSLPGKWVVVDGMGTIGEVHTRVMQQVRLFGSA